MDILILILILLQIKHCLVDFMLQTDEDLVCKGIYGHCLGINHSLKHGVGTFMCLLLVTGFSNFTLIMVLSFLNFIIHYHVDYLKVNYGDMEVSSTRFWRHLGLGQLMHQLTYLIIVYAALYYQIP